MVTCILPHLIWTVHERIVLCSVPHSRANDILSLWNEYKGEDWSFYLLGQNERRWSEQEERDPSVFVSDCDTLVVQSFVRGAFHYIRHKVIGSGRGVSVRRTITWADPVEVSTPTLKPKTRPDRLSLFGLYRSWVSSCIEEYNCCSYIFKNFNALIRHRLHEFIYMTYM